METTIEPPFLARTAEIENLRTFLGEIRQGKGRVLLLEGESGIGKTRILRELRRTVEREGMLVLLGRCYGKTVPYSAWVEMTYEYSHLVPQERLSKIAAGLPHEFSFIILPPETRQSSETELGIRGWLKGPLRSTAESRTKPVAAEGVDKIRLFETFLQFFTNISLDKPLVLIIDDLHLADSATVQLLRYFAGKVVSRRIAVMGSYREDQVGESESLSETIEDLKREGLCTLIHVEPLNLDETRELIEAVVDSPVKDESIVQRIFRVSQGNPFFVRELASSLVSKTTGSQASTGLPWMSSASNGLELPASIRAIVKKKLARLPPETVQVLSVASLIGQEFGFELIGDVAQTNEEDVMKHLETSVKANVVSEAPATKQVTYRFNHPIMREVLTEELGTARRRRYHRAIAEAIQRHESSESHRFLDIVAMHYLESGDETKAIELSMKAAERAEQMLAYDEAIRHLSNALELCEIPELRRRIDEDIQRLRAKEEGWTRFLQEEAMKVGIAGYDQIGENYERLVVPVFEPIARPIIERAELKPGQRVVDAGTGTGLLVRSIAPAVGNSGYVLGVDISQGMLSVARRKMAELGYKNVDFKLMDNTSLQLPDNDFDIAVSSFGMPAFNADKAVSEIHRVLKRHGVFVFDEWETVQAENKPGIIFEELLSRYKTTTPSEKLVTIREAASYRGRGFKKLYDKTTLLDWLKKAGFSNVETFKRKHEIRSTSFEDYLQYQAAWWTVDAELREMGDERRKEFMISLSEAFRPLMDSNGLLENVEVNYFKAQKM